MNLKLILIDKLIHACRLFNNVSEENFSYIKTWGEKM